MGGKKLGVAFKGLVLLTFVSLLLFGSTLLASEKVQIGIFEAIDRALENSSMISYKLEDIKAFKRSGSGSSLYFPSLSYYTDFTCHSLRVEYNINQFLAVFMTRLPQVTSKRLEAELLSYKMKTSEDIASLFLRLLTVRKILERTEKFFTEAETLLDEIKKDDEIPEHQRIAAEISFDRFNLILMKLRHEERLLSTDFKNRLSIPQETDVILKDDLGLLSESSTSSVVLSEISEEVIHNLPEVKAARFRMEESELEEKASFYRKKLPRMIPYLSLSITESEPTVEAGIHFSYNIGPFISLSAEGKGSWQREGSIKWTVSLSFDFNKGVSLVSSSSSGRSELDRAMQMFTFDMLRVMNTIAEAKVAMEISKKVEKLLDEEERYVTSKTEKLRLLLQKVSNIESYFRALQEYSIAVFKFKLWKGEFQRDLPKKLSNTLF